jgi:hypothetical protein
MTMAKRRTLDLMYTAETQVSTAEFRTQNLWKVRAIQYAGFVLSFCLVTLRHAVFNALLELQASYLKIVALFNRHKR